MFQYIHNTLDHIYIQESGVTIDHVVGIQGKRSLDIQKGVSEYTYVYIVDNASLDIQIRVFSPGVRIQIYGLVFGQKEMRCHTQLIPQSNTVQANMHLISFVQDNSHIEHRGTITIPPQYTQIQSHLLEEHIIWGEHIQIKAQPVLEISSHDVQASHGAKIERIDEEKLLYMMSRGLSKRQAQILVIDGYLNHIGDRVLLMTPSQDQDMVQKLLQQIKQNILL